MATTFDDLGRENIEDREVYFENGRPTNPDVWPAFKDLPKRIGNDPNVSIRVSERLITDCFNPVLDAYTNRMVRSSMEQFEIFCDRHFLQIEKADEHRVFEISLDLDKKLKAYCNG